MIPPKRQWCHQITVTSICWPHTGLGTDKRGPLSGCSNCTRLLAHEKKRYAMTPEQFRACLLVARDFVFNSPPCYQNRHPKVIGIFGGEPLMSPYFKDYVDIACELLPDPHNRGLWTSFDWTTYSNDKYGPAPEQVHRLLGTENGQHKGYLNWNMHDANNVCEHHPVLVAIEDVIKDEKHRWELINQCWLNRDWSAAYALDANGEPKFYFCEIASSFDRVMNLGTGLPVVPGVWDGDLELVPDEQGVLRPTGPYAAQVLATCGRCGQAIPIKKGRRDMELKDDISPMNLVQLQHSPMVQRGDFVEFGQPEIEAYNEEANKGNYAGQYIKEGVVRSTKMRYAGKPNPNLTKAQIVRRDRAKRQPGKGKGKRK